MVAKKLTTIEQVKAWLFPIVLGIFGTYIWQDIREIKADVKLLMAQSNIDKTRIDNLERIVFQQNAPTSMIEKKSEEFPSNHKPLDIYRCILLEDRKRRLSPDSREDLLA
jgi:hypothetical protein